MLQHRESTIVVPDRAHEGSTRWHQLDLERVPQMSSADRSPSGALGLADTVELGTFPLKIADRKSCPIFPATPHSSPVKLIES